MAAITIRNISEELVDRIKFLAEQKGVSMEQEVRDLLQIRYGQRSKVIERIQHRAACQLHKRAMSKHGRI